MVQTTEHKRKAVSDGPNPRYHPVLGTEGGRHIMPARTTDRGHRPPDDPG
jgi:hypothetical protein